MVYLLYGLAGLGGLALFYCLLLAVSALLVDPKKQYDRPSPYYRFLLNSATALAMKVLRVKILATGLDRVPKEGRFLLVSNHRSNFDPLVTWHMLPDRDLAFISKEENFHIPVFGRIIRRCCFMPIDRENPRNALLTVRRAAELIRADRVSVAVYPEGTRSKDCVLLPFRNGVFKIAQQAEVPLVAVCIRGTEQIHRRYIRHATRVYLDVVEVIPPEELAGVRTAMIGERVRDALAAVLEEDKP